MNHINKIYLFIFLHIFEKMFFFSLRLSKWSLEFVTRLIILLHSVMRLFVLKNIAKR